ncbi:MAG: delta-lactam-biosynthetic de-N-acetylase [Clostridia bacterium]|nr:delta-lactam-biosynthetic de-N-acetylase [Clostridia bacterium]
MYWIIRRRHTVIALVCCAALLIGAVTVSRMHTAVSVATGAANTNWGLRFAKDGETPVGNASAEFLAKYNALYTGNTGEKVIYLTFDAGYDNGYTAPILDTLKKHGVPAAFFVVGNFADTQPELIKRMAAEGHIVGNHTYNHPDMSAISTAEGFDKELAALEERYQEITGQEMKKFYRPPQGKYSEQNLKMAADRGYTTCFWSLAYVDWYVDKQPTREEAFSKLIPRIHPGAVVLLHSTSKTNCEILDELLTKWKEMGYTFKSLEDI